MELDLDGIDNVFVIVINSRCTVRYLVVICKVLRLDLLISKEWQRYPTYIAECPLVPLVMPLSPHPSFHSSLEYSPSINPIVQALDSKNLFKFLV